MSSTFDYNKIQDTALNLIEKFGADATVKKASIAAGANAWNAPQQVASDKVGKAVRTEYSLYNINGTTIKAGDVKLLLAAKDLTVMPAQGDTVVFAGTEYKVMNIDPIAPAEVILVYVVQLRR